MRGDARKPLYFPDTIKTLRPSIFRSSSANRPFKEIKLGRFLIGNVLSCKGMNLRWSRLNQYFLTGGVWLFHMRNKVGPNWSFFFLTIYLTFVENKNNTFILGSSLSSQVLQNLCTIEFKKFLIVRVFYI